MRAVVNSAGIGVGGPLDFVAIEDLRRQFEVNVIGQVAVTQALVGLLRARPGSRTVFVSSVGSRVSAPFFGPYAASKRAVNALGDSWRRELEPWDIRVSVLIVAPAATPSWAKASKALEELRHGLPPRGLVLYGDALSKVALYVDTKAPASAIDVETVVCVAVRAIDGRRPRATYLVGHQTRVGVMLSTVLPTRVFDALLRAHLR